MLLAAACAKEPVVDEPEANKVPLDITIQTKAGGDGDGEDVIDVSSIRVVVFGEDTANSAQPLILNEFYPYGFDAQKPVGTGVQADYKVSVRPVLELDPDIDHYYVYVVLNEEGYTLSDGNTVSAALEGLTNLSSMTTCLATPAVYSKGIQEVPFCLMSGMQEIDFETPDKWNKDYPMPVTFDFSTTAADNKALKRNMAQITIGSITSVPNGGTDDANLPRLLVTAVELVNVPKDMTWSSAQGSSTTSGGKISLPIGEASETYGSDEDHKYYARNWNGSVYQNLGVTFTETDETDAKLYRTDQKDMTGWSFSGTPYTYTITDQGAAPTPVDRPYGYPVKYSDGKWHYIIVDNVTAGTNKDEILANDENKAKQAYRGKDNKEENIQKNLPFKPNGERVTASEVLAYEQYLKDLATYRTKVQDAYTKEDKNKPGAVQGLGLIAKNYGERNDNIIPTIVSDLEDMFSQDLTTGHDFWEQVKSYAEITAVSSYGTTYCSDESWEMNFNETYYVPENISSSFDAASTTCIHVRLALATPAIGAGSVALASLPSPDFNPTTDNTYAKFYLDNYWYSKVGDSFTEPHSQAYVLTEYGNQDQYKMSYNEYRNGKIDNLKDRKDFNMAILFKANGHIVNADDPTIDYPYYLAGDNIPIDNNFNVYVDGFYRKVTGCTGTSIINDKQAGATFTWGLGTATYKDFYIPVNNLYDETGAKVDNYSVVRNTKYSVDLTVTPTTYDDLTKASAEESGDDFGFGISATVKTEKLTDYED